MRHASFRRHLLSALCLPLLSLQIASLQAQTWPERPIRMIVPSTPGGTLDVVGRFLGEGLQPILKQSIVVDNKAGGAGMIGVGEMLKAPRDGYTIIMHISGIVSEIPHIVPPPYDPFRDLKPLVEVGHSGLVFVTHPDNPAKDVKEAIGRIKANPGKTNYGSYSVGTISHTLGIELNRLMGLDMNHVGYKGSVPALQDLMGGSIQYMFDGPATSLPLITAGKLRALAVTSPKRMAALPSVPTFAELGLGSLTQTPWVGIFIAPDVPAPVQARLREAILQVMQQPAFRQRLAGLGLDTGEGATSEALSKGLMQDSEKHGTLLKSIVVKP